MNVDTDNLSEQDLIDLNHRVVERLGFLRQVRAHHAMLALRIGELGSSRRTVRERFEVL